MMTFDGAMSTLTRQERFMATVYAMNTLLLLKKVYSASEFERCFIEWAAKERRRKARQTRRGRAARRRPPRKVPR